MNHKNIIDKVISEADNFQSMSVEELKEMIDKELSKSDDEIDYELIDELTTNVLEAEGKQRLTVDVDAELDKIKKRTSKHKKIFHIPKWAIALSAACIMLVGANCISVRAWNLDIVSALIEVTKGGFSVDFNGNNSESINLPTSEDDPYGMIAECLKYDIYPEEVPYYIPDNFVLSYIDTNVNKEYANTVHFIFKNGKKNLSIHYTRYWKEAGQIGIPSDHYNISETTVNGSPAIVSKEDNQYTITYLKDKTLFFMFADGVPYDECEKIVESIK